MRRRLAQKRDKLESKSDDVPTVGQMVVDAILFEAIREAFDGNGSIDLDAMQMVIDLANERGIVEGREIALPYAMARSIARET